MGHHNPSGRATVIEVRRSWTLMASSSVERVKIKTFRRNERTSEQKRERGEAVLVDDIRREGETRAFGGKGGGKG